MTNEMNQYIEAHREQVERMLGEAVNALMNACPPDRRAFLHAFFAPPQGPDASRELESARARVAELERELEVARARIAELEEQRQKESTVATWKLASARAAPHRAADVWKDFEVLLRANPAPDAIDGGKLVAPAKFFVLGDATTFLNGLRGMMEENKLTRSMEEEARENEGGKWWPEYEYVVQRPAEEDVDLPSTNGTKGKTSTSQHVIVRDQGHAGMRLADFCEHPTAVEAKLTAAEVAALRLYTGPMYKPINNALRKKEIGDWATTIACCYLGVLKLSLLQKESRRVYRGVKETPELGLPPEFLEGTFAGGVELAFMSTTTSPAVALDYSGGAATQATILAFEFKATTRGASVQWLSQYPHEEELLFPPCTSLMCDEYVERGRKRCVCVTAHVSTARLDTEELTTPQHVPGGAAAWAWLAETCGRGVDVLRSADEWDLSNTNLAAPELHERVAFLLGRCVPAVRSVVLQSCALDRRGAVAFAGALTGNTVLTSLDVSRNSIGNEGAKAFATALSALTNLNLGGNELCGLDFQGRGTYDASGIQALASALAGNAVLTSLNVADNSIGNEGAKAFATALSDGNTVLKTLNLDHNGIGAEGTKALAAALSDGRALLTDLELFNNKIDAEGAKAIAEALRSGKAVLISLDLSKNDLTNYVLDRNHNGTIGSLSGIKALLRHSVLKKLVLSANQLEDEGAVAVGESLKSNESLEELGLAQCGVRVKGAKALAAALSDGRAVLTDLDLRFNRIGAEGAKAIAEALGSGKAVLTSLDLEGNEVGPDGTKALASALAENAVLKKLGLVRNYIGDEGAKALAAALSDGKAVLTSLNLLCNGIGAEGAKAIAAALGSAVLKTLDLGCNRIGPEGAKAIAAALGSGTSVLIECSLLKNDLDVESAKMLAKIGTEKQIMLFYIKCDETEADFSDQLLKPADAILISSDLPFMAVTNINLAKNELCGLDWQGKGTYDASGIKALASALAGSAALTKLDLRENGIRDIKSDLSAMKALEDIAAQRKTLKLIL